MSKILLTTLSLSLILKIPAKANTEICTLCKNETAFLDAGTGLQKHTSEVTITNNCKYSHKWQIIKDDFCKGTIVGAYNVLTSVSCIETPEKLENFCVYARYLHVKDNISFLKRSISNVSLHPHFDPNNEVLILKLSEPIQFDEIYCGLTRLPDDVINTVNFKENDCFVSGYTTGTELNDVQPFSIKVEILQYDECMDIANVNNVTMSIDKRQYCVLTQRTEKNSALHVNGKGVICKNVLTGLMTNSTHQLREFSSLFPVIDVGRHSTWVRSVRLNLKLASNPIDSTTRNVGCSYLLLTMMSLIFH